MQPGNYDFVGAGAVRRRGRWPAWRFEDKQTEQ
jgi:hypothetical protein